MKYIIMCGGDYKKWDTPRQLLPICGEPIVARTIRLLRDEGVDDVAISTNDPHFEGLGVPLMHHVNEMTVTDHVTAGSWVNAFYRMEKPACYLMGDVVFSPEAIRKIVATETGSIAFFGSVPPFSPLYRREWAEPFAFKVQDQRQFCAAIDFVLANLDTGIFRRSPIAWELWQVICGGNVREIDYETVIAINDYTCDVDHPEDAKIFEENICEL